MDKNMSEHITIKEYIKLEGKLRIYRPPSHWTDSDYAYWWLPETDGKGNTIRPARLSDEEKEQYFETEGHNIITNVGRAQALSYLGSSSGSSTQWAQQFAIGTGAITSTSPIDTSLSNEVFRKAPISFSVNGTQLTINIILGTTDAQVTMTNGGIYGNFASSTLNSGSLLTHCLFSYTKGAYSVAVSYIINLL